MLVAPVMEGPPFHLDLHQEVVGRLQVPECRIASEVSVGLIFIRRKASFQRISIVFNVCHVGGFWVSIARSALKNKS
jgi:hypothetical protein